MGMPVRIRETMKTTLILPWDLYKELKRVALDCGLKLQEALIEAVILWLSTHESVKGQTPVLMMDRWLKRTGTSTAVTDLQFQKNLIQSLSHTQSEPRSLVVTSTEYEMADQVIRVSRRVPEIMRPLSLLLGIVESTLGAVTGHGARKSPPVPPESKANHAQRTAFEQIDKDAKAIDRKLEDLQKTGDAIDPHGADLREGRKGPRRKAGNDS